MAVIVQIAGTSGSGKSHLMRSFMDELAKKASWTEEFVDGRTRPLGYVWKGASQIFVPGAYDSPTGGCDTIKDVSQVFSLVHGWYQKGYSVVFEGLFCMNQTRAPQLVAKIHHGYHVLQLTTPLATCMESINNRRAERGVGALENKENTVGNYNRSGRFCLGMRESGAKIHKVSREEGLPKLLEILNV